MRWLLCISLLGATVLQAQQPYAGETPPLVVEAKISLGNIKGRIDHLSYDPARERLYVAELGNDSVAIVDLRNQRLLRTVSGFDEPQGIGYEPATDSVYVANGGDGSVRIFRGEDFAPLGQIALGADADNVRVDGASGRVYVGYGNGALAVIDAITRKHIGDIPLKSHPESFHLESTDGRIFVNVPDARVIQVVSRDTYASIATWTTATLRANFPLTIDAPNHRLLAVFRQPARLEAFDLTDGSRLGGVDACGDADDIFVDPRRSYLYVICGEGAIDTYASANKTFRRAGQLAISRGSRTGLYLPTIDRLVVAIRSLNQEAAAIWILRPTAPATPSAPRTGEILFVCEHGNVKSLMAASYFNQMAHERKLPFRAVSRGSAPDSTTVPPAIVAGLRKDAIDVVAFHPAAVEAEDIAASQQLVLINTELPANMQAKDVATERWTDVPPASVNFDAARDSLKAHVARLIDQLEHSNRK